MNAVYLYTSFEFEKTESSDYDLRMLNTYKTRKNKPNTRNVWNLENIKESVEKYKAMYQKYPSTLDFDKVDFLPSSRLIQRNYGGIVKLKQLLHLDDIHDFTKGEYRSKVASTMYKNAVDLEESFYNYLTSRMPEINIHEHKILRPGHICCDFFVYTSANSGFAIDIFYAGDLFNLSRIITNKAKRYSTLGTLPVFFVLVGNVEINQDHVDIMVNNKKDKLLPNIKVCTEEFFKDYVLEGLLKDVL